MKLNVAKYEVMHFGRQIEEKQYKLNGIVLKKVSIFYF